MKLYMPTRHTLCYSSDAIAPTRGSGPPKHYPKLPALLHWCFWCTAAKLYCGVACSCCVWMCTLAVSDLCIRWARCKLGYRAPERTSSDWTCKKSHNTSRWETPAPFSRLHSKQQQYQMYASVWSLRSDRLPLQASRHRKNVCSSTKMPSASGGRLCPLDPRWGFCTRLP